EELSDLFDAILVKPARSNLLRQKVATILGKGHDGANASESEDKASSPTEHDHAKPDPIAETTAPTPTPATTTTPSQAGPNGAERKAIRILVADDNAVNHKLIAAMLANGGYEIEVAEDGRKAVDAYRKSLPDLVLMDVSMPRLDGLEATAEIREIERDLG